MFAAFISAMALLVLLDVGIATRRDSNWWAAWGGWVGGIGSFAAAASAVWVALKGWQHSDEAAAKVEQQEQAARLGVWIDWAGERDVHRGMLFPYPGVPVVKYVNASSMPVYDAEVVVQFAGPLRGYQAVQRALAPTTEPLLFEPNPGEFHSRLEEIMTHERGVVLAEFGTLTNQAIPDAVLLSSVLATSVITCYFTDSNGLRWRRVAGAPLELLGEAPLRRGAILVKAPPDLP